MKRVFLFLQNLLPHFTVILSMMLITFFIIDRFNEAMAFLTNDISKWLVALLCFFSLFSSLRLIVLDYRKKKKSYEETDRDAKKD